MQIYEAMRVLEDEEKRAALSRDIEKVLVTVCSKIVIKIN